MQKLTPQSALRKLAKTVQFPTPSERDRVVVLRQTFKRKKVEFAARIDG